MTLRGDNFLDIEQILSAALSRSPGALRELVESWPESDPLWRALSLRLLEERLLDQELGLFLDDLTSSPSVPLATPSVTKQASRRQFQIHPLLLTCALFLFLTGWGAGYWTSVVSSSASVAMPMAQAAPSDREKDIPKQATLPTFDQVSSENKTEDSPELFELVLSDEKRQTISTAKVPFIQDADLPLLQDMLSLPIVSEAMREQLLQTGQQVTEVQQVYEVAMPDGKMGYVPIRELQIQPNERLVCY